jgi:hypothetical protein
VPCSVCGKPSKAQGLCKPHYDAARKTGVISVRVVQQKRSTRATEPANSSEQTAPRLRLKPEDIFSSRGDWIE